MRALLASALEQLPGPVKVSEAASGFEALRALARDRYDLILTDINMPDINGLELVSFVKRSDAYGSIPLVIVSTEGSERDRERGLALGADAYLVKPFEPEDLCALVRDLLDARRRGGCPPGPPPHAAAAPEQGRTRVRLRGRGDPRAHARRARPAGRCAHGRRGRSRAGQRTLPFGALAQGPGRDVRLRARGRPR